MSEFKFPENLESIQRKVLEKHIASVKNNIPEIEPIPLSEHIEKTEQYQAMSLQMLESINKNTANLYTIVELINQSTEQQDEIVSLLVEILGISKAKTREEASNWYRKSMDRINQTIKDGEALMKIVSFAVSVYTAIQPLLDK